MDITSQGTGTHKLVSWADPDKTTRGAMSTGGATGNAVGSVQLGELQSHHHEMGHELLVRLGAPLATMGSGAGHLGPTKTLATGGSETRPKNINVNYIIKY